MSGKGMKGLSRWVLSLVAAIFWGLVLTGSGYGETLRFVFLADSRASKATATICPDQPLIDTCALNAINSQILALSPRPAFVIFGGDMAYRGHYKGAYTYQKFKDAMKAVTDAGIKLYVVLGNHELYREPPTPFNGSYYKRNQEEYQKVFADMPANGPAGYKSLVYSFESPGKDCFFAVLDPYYLTKDMPDPFHPPNINGRIDDTQLTWLTGQIAQTQATHKFLAIHVPYYLITSTRPEDVSYTKLWQLLDNNHFDIYFCGHIHLYSRKTIDSLVQPKPQLSPPIQWKNNVVQLLSGTCGAEATRGGLVVDPLSWNVNNDQNVFYFSVVDVNGSVVNVHSYSGTTSGKYSLMDSFTVPPSDTAATSFLLDDCSH